MFTMRDDRVTIYFTPFIHQFEFGTFFLELHYSYELHEKENENYIKFLKNDNVNFFSNVN